MPATSVVARPAKLPAMGAGAGEDAVPFDERRLVERARTDADAFEALYRAYVHRIHAFAWRRTGSRQAAEDITSATFERVLRNLDGFRWRGGGFGPWLFRIAANAVTDHHRAEARVRSPRGQLALATNAPAAAPDPADAVTGDDPELRRALARLNPRYQEALTLRFVVGLEPADVAAALGVSKATVAVVVSRASAALRRELGRERGSSGIESRGNPAGPSPWGGPVDGEEGDA